MPELDRPKEQMDLLTLLRSAPYTLTALVSDLSAEQAAQSPAEGWSISEVVAHMLDGERSWFSRIRRMFEEEHPWMEPIPNPDYSKPSLEESMRDYRSSRQVDLEYLESRPPDSWSRGGTHSLWGEIDVSWAARHLAAHDAEHLAQIAELLQETTPTTL